MDDTEKAAVATPVEGGETPAPTGQAQAAATGGADAVEARINAEIARIRAEYEGKGGKMAKLQSENARMKREQADRAAAAAAQAKQAIRSDDPAQVRQAAQALAEANDALLSERNASTMEQQVTEWANKVATNLGLGELPPEDVMEIAQKSGVGQKAGAEFDMQQAIAQRAVENANKRATEAEKKLRETLESLPTLVKGEVAKLMQATGLAPDTSATEPRPGKPKETDVPGDTPEERMRNRILEERRLRQQQKQ